MHMCVILMHHCLLSLSRSRGVELLDGVMRYNVSGHAVRAVEGCAVQILAHLHCSRRFGAEGALCAGRLGCGRGGGRLWHRLA
jgi:hypothetical protein